MCPEQAFPITAYGLCNALGSTKEEVVRGLSEGRSGIGAPPFSLPFPTVVGAVKGQLPKPPSALSQYDSRVLRMVLVAYNNALSARVAQAVERYGAHRVAIIMGTSTGGIGETEAAFHAHTVGEPPPERYNFDCQHSFTGFSDALALISGVKGPRYVISTACSSSGKALAAGLRLLRLNQVDAVLSGGVDGLCQTTLRGFHSLSIHSERACRPFCQDRDGITIGEGAAMVLVEREGQGLANLLAVGESGDAFHMSSPDPEGRGALAAMKRALDQAGLPVSAVDHINAHGTGTKRNDIAESKAVATMFGTELPVASTKGYTGHLLGAGGTTEAIFAMIALEQGWVPATLGADPVDPDITIKVALKHTTVPCQVVMSNSFGFGGSNVSVLLGAGS